MLARLWPRKTKVFGTNKAWEVQDKLEEFYFTCKAEAAQPEESPLLSTATKAQREPLIKAIHHFLASVAKAKGRALTFVMPIINLKIGVDSVEALTVE